MLVQQKTPDDFPRRLLYSLNLLDPVQAGFSGTRLELDGTETYLVA